MDGVPVQDIDDILRNRTEKRQLGNSKGNTFSTATFTIEEEPQVPQICPPAHHHFPFTWMRPTCEWHADIIRF